MEKVHWGGGLRPWMKYEYKVINHSTTALESNLNRWAREGWRVFDRCSNPLTDEWSVILERQWAADLAPLPPPPDSPF